MTDPKHPDRHPLVVDDDADFIRLLGRVFEKVGVPRPNIRRSSDGEEAIALLSRGGWTPSFVLLDLNMPRRSGLEVLEWIRRAPVPLGEVLVFMLTSDAAPEHVARAFQLGVASYFIKPMGLPALEDVLEGIMAHWKSRHRPTRTERSRGSHDIRGR